MKQTCGEVEKEILKKIFLLACAISVIHPDTMSQIKQRKDASLNYSKVWTASRKAEEGLKSLLVRRPGVSLCGLSGAPSRRAGASRTEGEESH